MVLMVTRRLKFAQRDIHSYEVGCIATMYYELVRKFLLIHDLIPGFKLPFPNELTGRRVTSHFKT